MDNDTRDVDTSSTGKKYNIPAKVMRYFLLKPRLQHVFMCKEYAELMTWHVVGCIKDGKLRHSADAEAWKSLSARYPDFAVENRNVRLGLAADAFSPYRTMGLTHSTWLVILVNYNLPPWLIIKPENIILSTLILGPVYPGNEIDVYMQPLVFELKVLWDMGIETYDSFSDETFTLRASLLWTISDFPGYAVLSGYNTKGKLGCPNCHYCTSSTYLKHSRKVCYINHRKFLPPDHKLRFDKRRFNGQIETEFCPPLLTGAEIEELLREYKNNFWKQMNQKKTSDCPWKKKSIFFKLPYWSGHLIRHNLDVINIEKNAGFIFRGICGKVIDLEDVPSLQVEIIEILCQYEIIFPPAFFDIMVHLPIHLYKEVELGGPSYVRNKSKPEGCIAEGYLVEECLSFCSRFLSDERETKHNKVKENLGYPIGSRRNKDGKVVRLGEKLWNDAHRYILFNCGDMDVEKLI
ncbi:uncharacterized protein LOC141666097 [Apium graveolens]|uniref:uncharacterized protein LOC141666097 n=1 Tax=Apium graveolens TaxID=4045 RepID=UPI003D78E82D